MTAAVDPPRWKPEDFQRDLEEAIQIFRHQRLEEPVDEYRKHFEACADQVQDLLSRTDNLSNALSSEPDVAAELLANPELRAVVRYLSGPPISEDDLKTLADASSLAPSRLSEDDAAVRRIMDVIQARLDTKRFPWASEPSAPDTAELHTAVVASASLMATQRAQTSRRNTNKADQEARVKDYLDHLGLEQVEPRPIPTLDVGPQRGQFCGECQLGTRKADIVVGLHDGRCLPIECKVSNSAVNSVKRLNNDAAAKAAQWVTDFGKQVVPSAVLSGVFKRHNLLDAQQAGLTIFWAHNLDPLGEFIHQTEAQPL
ncbi:MAG: XamI family restriction endonuclease [Acidimicrobiaceae bacterium]|nr:XamI family restriction endonuclease [Acidimicrobiaceae bacterium]